MSLHKTIVDDKWVGMWKEGVVVFFREYSSIYLDQRAIFIRVSRPYCLDGRIILKRIVKKDKM
jgi:hypothetical protein